VATGAGAVNSTLINVVFERDGTNNSDFHAIFMPSTFFIGNTRLPGAS
jgi:hypothetical protein